MTDMDPVVHFEMPYQDSTRVALFYAQVFGWQMQLLGKEMGEYILAGTIETDTDHMPLHSGGINGGFFPKGPDMPQCPSVVIAVGDIRQAMKKVSDAGGSILGEPVLISGIGMYVAIIDTEGNRVEVLEPINP